MSYSTAGKNTILAADGISHLALFTGYPADSPSNEVTGGSPAYARKAITFGSPASGSKALSSPVTFDLTGDAQWAGGMTASSGGTLRARWPLGGSAKEFDVDASTDVVTCYAHGYSNGDQIVFYGGSAPGALTIGTIYFVRDATTDTFKVAATSGGAAINITSKPSTADALVSRIIPSTGSQRELTVNTLTLDLNK